MVTTYVRLYKSPRKPNAKVLGMGLELGSLAYACIRAGIWPQRSFGRLPLLKTVMTDASALPEGTGTCSQFNVMKAVLCSQGLCMPLSLTTCQLM